MTKPADRTVALIVVTLAAFLAPFMGSATNIALPTIGKEFALDAVTLGWISTAYLLASAMALVPFGRVADIFGRKRVFVSGAAVFAVASFLIGLAPSGAILIALRVVQGLGGAMYFSTGIAILTSVYPSNQKGRVLGFNTAAVYTGLSVGPTVGGILTQHFGWRSIFFSVTPLALLVVVLTLWKLSGEWAEARGDSFDVPGTLLYGASLLAIMYGFSSLPALFGFVLLAGGLLGLVLFVVWEGKTPSPVLNVRIFRNNTVFAFSNLAALINYSATSATGFLLSLYLQQIRGVNPQTAGLILVAQPLMQAIFSPFTGHLSDSVEPRILASAGMGLTALGLICFAFISPQTPIAVVVLLLMLLGLGFGLFSSPNTNAVMSSVDKRFLGVASATLSTMRNVGQTLSIGVVMVIFSLYIGHVAIAPENYPALMSSIKVAFSLFSVLCVAGIFFSLARGKVR